jgi:hypothetical protein
MWRSRVNREPEIVKVIKAGRLKWLGPHCAIEEQDHRRKLTFHKPGGIRRAVRWLDPVEEIEPYKLGAKVAGSRPVEGINRTGQGS